MSSRLLRCLGILKSTSDAECVTVCFYYDLLLCVCHLVLIPDITLNNSSSVQTACTKAETTLTDQIKGASFTTQFDCCCCVPTSM